MAAPKLELPVNALATLPPRLMTALAPYGLSAAELESLFAKGISAACVKCGLRLSGNDLSQVALAASADSLADPKLARVRQGYCGRNGCDSCFYTLTFGDHFKVNWDAVVRALESSVPVESEGASGDDAPPARNLSPERKAMVTRVAIGVGVLVVLLLARHVMYGGRIPLLQAKPNYQVSAESVLDDPAAPGLPAPSTNRIH